MSADAATIAVNLIIEAFGSSGGSGSLRARDFTDAIGVINRQIDNTFNHLRALIEQAIAENNTRANGIESLINNQFRDQSSQIFDWLTILGTTLLESIKANNRAIGRIDTSSNDAAIDQILEWISILRKDTGSVASTILTPTLKALNGIKGDVFNLQNSIDSGFLGVLDEVTRIVDILNGQNQLVIENQILIDESIFGSVLRNVEAVMDTVLAEQSNIIGGIVGAFSLVFKDLLGTIRLGELNEIDQVKRIADILGGQNQGTLDNLNRMGDGSVDGFGGLFGKGFGEAVVSQINEGLSVLRARGLDQLAGHEHREDLFDCGLAAWDDTWVDNDVPNFITETLIWIVTALMVPLNASQVKANKVMQEYRRCFPDALMQVGDLANAWHRGLITPEKAIEDIEKQGFTHEDAETMLQTSHLIPTIDMILVSWLREDTTESEAVEQLRGLGYTDKAVRSLMEMAFFIPPVQDLVTMSVREVFNEEIVKANRQDDDFPQEFANWAKKQGVSDFWAHKYWQAHWRLPSEQMGFEMLHRGIIDEERLRELLIALDIMPGWRDEIIDISYVPFTRVDIRRMHAMGVLSDEEVERAYLDIGYDKEKAAVQKEFVKRLNADEDEGLLDVVSDLSRATIIKFFDRGLIDRQVTNLLLLQAGINPIAAEMFIDIAELEMELERRDKELAIILTRFRVGEINFEEANADIIALNLEPAERQAASLELLKTKEAITKQPSKADLGDFYEAGIIDGDEYINGLMRLGFSYEWSEKFLLLLWEEITDVDEQTDPVVAFEKRMREWWPVK